MPHEDRFALRLLALTHGVRLVVHGHLHRAEERRVNGVRIIGAPASTEPDRSGKVNVWRYAVYVESGRVIAELLGVAVR
jgi:predicted phosphodiesterase